MKELLQDCLDLKLFGDCLEKSLYKIYKEYLCERILNEVTVDSLAINFKHKILDRNEIDSEKATVNILKTWQKMLQQIKYERKFGKIIPTGITHLEKDQNEFCTKAIFKKEFEKENFDEYKNKEDLAAADLVELLLDGYLEMYDDQG